MGLQLENNTESTFIQRHHVEYMSCQCTLPGSLCFICLIIYSFFNVVFFFIFCGLQMKKKKKKKKNTEFEIIYGCCVIVLKNKCSEANILKVYFRFL